VTDKSTFHLLNLIATISLCLAAGSAIADEQAPPERIPPELRAMRIDTEQPVIDGNLNDPIWQHPQMDFARDFRQRGRNDGEPATESTLVAVAYDDAAIYVAFWCYDSEPNKIMRQLVRRDRTGESDLVSVRLDPYHDHQSGYDFYVNSAGVHTE